MQTGSFDGNREKEFSEIICRGDENSAVAFARQCIAEGMTPMAVYTDLICPFMDEMSSAFERLEIYLPELMKTAMCVREIQEQVLLPEIKKAGDRGLFKARVIIGTCQGDIHEVGKSMVSMLLCVNGFDVVDLGTNVKPDDFVNAAQQHKADIIAMSSMLTASLPFVKDVIGRLVTLGVREQYKIVVGGAAVTPEWASMAGLDGFGRDAVEAVNICNKLIDTAVREEISA